MKKILHLMDYKNNFHERWHGRKIVTKEEVNINPHIQHNKRLYNLNDGYSKSREMKRVASIPTLALSVWANEYNGSNNWFGLPKEVQKKY